MLLLVLSFGILKKEVVSPVSFNLCFHHVFNSFLNLPLGLLVAVCMHALHCSVYAHLLHLTVVSVMRVGVAVIVLC